MNGCRRLAPNYFRGEWTADSHPFSLIVPKEEEAHHQTSPPAVATKERTAFLLL
jgi:hypothetical protein